MNCWKPWKLFSSFGSGKSYAPDLSSCCEEQQVSAQGLLDTFFLDKETIDSIKNIINAIDPEKVKAVMEVIEVDKDGWLRVKIDLGLKK